MVLYFLLGLLMALPDPKKPAPGTPVPRTPADATAVYYNHPFASFLKLIGQLHATTFEENFQKKTSLAPSYADTLSVLAGAAPLLIGTNTVPSDRGDFWPQVHELDIRPIHSTMELPNGEVIHYPAYSPKEMRATMAHEFGHIMDFSTPGFLDRFKKLNPHFPSEAQQGGKVDIGQETLADAFAQAVRGVIPDVGEESAHQYWSSQWLINAQQKALLDSLVQARAKLLR